MKSFGFDHTMCIGCEACVVACKQVNRAEKGQGLRQVRTVNDQRLDGLPTYYLSFSCNHCKEPKCVEVCPKKAMIKREDGIVVLDQGLCDGCRECLGACPYEAIKANALVDKVIKCNMCVDNLDEGEIPLCVQTCPTGALTICESLEGNISESILSEIFRDISRRKSGGCNDETVK